MNKKVQVSASWVFVGGLRWGLPQYGTTASQGREQHLNIDIHMANITIPIPGVDNITVGHHCHPSL